MQDSRQKYIKNFTVGTCVGILQAGTAIVGNNISFSYTYEELYAVNAYQKDIWDKKRYPFWIKHVDESQTRFLGSANARLYYYVWGKIK